MKISRFKKNVAVLLLPLILKYIFLSLFVDFDLVEWGDVGEDVLFFVAVASILYSNILKKRFLKNTLCFFYVLYFVLETTSYLAVSSNFTSSYMFLLIESNEQELGEFIGSYFNIKILLLFVLMMISFFILKKQEFKATGSKKMVLGLALFVAIFASLKLTGMIERNAYHNIVRGVYGYFDLQNSMKLDTNIQKEDITISADNEVLVVVLGESTTRRHMQLYGYHRETTPLISSLKDDLLVFDNVVASDIITTKSLPLILSSSYKGGNREAGYSIIDIFNVAGYKTYWLSNQRPIGFFDNKISEIASSASYLKFLNHRNEVKTTSYDDVLIPELSLVLKEECKKVIFLHLIGTHFDYENRYPSNFEKFRDFNSKSRKVNVVNHYDNAILHNDFVVFTLIENLKKANAKSALLYLSDHGENVYHEGTDFFGRNEERLTKSMFEIPFLVWTSKTFQLPENFEYAPDRFFTADHTYESILHLFGVKHKHADFTKSIFSDSFKPCKRFVLDNIDFDTRFSGSYE